MDDLRKEWLAELEQLGILTDHHESMNDHYVHLTRPAFNKIESVCREYINILQDCEEKWYLDVLECLEEAGGSPRQMQSSMIKILKNS